VYFVGYLYVFDHRGPLLVVVPAENLICSYDAEVLSISNTQTLHTNYFKRGNKLCELKFSLGILLQVFMSPKM